VPNDSKLDLTSGLHSLLDEADMHDIKERLSLFWIFALLNYLYADVVALFSIVGSRTPFEHCNKVKIGP
jgi:hypothetical protein